MEDMHRPGSEMHGIAQLRAQKFNQNFFASLVEKAETTGLYTSVGGDVTFDADVDRFPTLDEAWNRYRNLAKQMFIRPDYMAFQEGFKKVQQIRQQQSWQDLSYATNAGATPKDIQNLARKNPALHHKLISMSATNPELAAQLSQFLPGPTLGEKMEASPGYYAAAGLGTAGAMAYGANYMGSATPETIEAAKAGYKSAIKGQLGELRAGKELVAEANATVAKLQNERITKGIPSNNKVFKKKIDTAKGQLKQAKAELAKTQKKLGGAKKVFRRDVSKTRYQSLKDSKYLKGKLGVGVKIGAYMAGPMIIGKAAGAISDDETVGELAERSASAALGAKFTKDSLMKIIKKKGASFVFKEVAAKAGYGKALRTLGKLVASGVGTGLSGGLLTGVLAAWTVKDVMDIMKIISEIE